MSIRMHDAVSFLEQCNSAIRRHPQPTKFSYIYEPHCPSSLSIRQQIDWITSIYSGIYPETSGYFQYSSMINKKNDLSSNFFKFF